MRYFLAITSLVLSALMLFLGVGQRTFLAGPKTLEETISFGSGSGSYLVIEKKVLQSKPGKPAVTINGEQVFLSTGNMRDINGWVEEFDHTVVEFDDEDNAIKTRTVRGVKPTVDENVEEGKEEQVEEEQVLLDPRGSDLWISENTNDTFLRIHADIEDSQGVFVTSGDDEIVLPEETKIIWVQPRVTPFAGPLLVLGGVFGVLGVLLYLLAVDHDRRGLGPRRGRRGVLQGIRNRKVKLEKPKTKKPVSGGSRGTRLGFSVAAATAGALLLSACSPDYWPQPVEIVEEVEETIDENLAVVPVSDEQLQKIFEEIVETMRLGDEELDASIIEERLAGPALIQREANYTVNKKNSDWHELPHLTNEILPYGLVQSTEKWPRTIFVTAESTANLESLKPVDEDETKNIESSDSETEEETKEEEEEVKTPTLALVLKQETAHENYKVHNIVQLRGGIEMPEVAPASEGTAVLTDDLKTMSLSPREAAETLAEIMQDGYEDPETAAAREEAEKAEKAKAEEEAKTEAEKNKDAKSKEDNKSEDETEIEEEEEEPPTASSYFSFAEEEILIEKMGSSWAKTQCAERLKCSAEVVLSEDPITTFSTGQTGVLVLATILDSHIMESNDERYIPELSAAEKALGLDGNYERVVREWQHQILMYVPGKDSDKQISILGSSTELIGASGKKAEIDR